MTFSMLKRTSKVTKPYTQEETVAYMKIEGSRGPLPSISVGLVGNVVPTVS